MIGLLDALLGRESRPRDLPAAAEHQIAAAALLVEAATVDGELAAAERSRIERLLAERLGCGPWLAGALITHALASVGSDWQGYTRVLKETYDADGQIAIVEMLWEVVLADGTLHDYEASLMRRVPALLYVSDRDNAAARGRALERLRDAAPGPSG